MRKFLVVGCGGSGAKTQAYMMDQLKALLRQIEPERRELPKCWQFVTIDVPIAPEAGPDNLPNVQQGGGRYIGIGSRQQYSTFDLGVSGELIKNHAMKEVATWATPMPDRITTPVSDGAGQYRGIGRMLTIPAFKRIQEGLDAAMKDLNKAETNTELDELNYKLTNKRSSAQGSTPSILVISSMAGGAGASMFLDVCRILSTIPNAKPEHTGVFMLTPEVFSDIPKDMMVGAWPNSLAMFGEAIACQTGAAAKSDSELFEAMGINGASRINTFARMFPIGNRMGQEGAQFGDGSAKTIYRGLGRALSALMYSDTASESFVQYSLANTGSPDGNRNYLGWADPGKVTWDVIPWGSMGYAQLSMGRDKYAEYAAQRLARSAFDRLLHGHIDPLNPATGEEQLKARLEERLPNLLQSLGIDPNFRHTQPNGAMIASWLDQNFSTEITNAINANLQWLRQSLPQPTDGQQGRDWANEINQRLNHPAISQHLTNSLNAAAYQAVYDYADRFMDAVIAAAESEMAVVGVPFVQAVLDQLSDIIQQRILNALNEVVQSTQNMNPAARPGEVDSLMHPLSGNRRVHGGAEVLDQIAMAYRQQVRSYMLVALSRNLLPVLDDFRIAGLSRLQREIGSAHADLEEANKKKDVATNLADVSTTDPVIWPTESDERISDRFRGSHNEILITEVDSFPNDYATQLVETVRVADPEVFDLNQASRQAARAVILGDWVTTDALRPPQDTLARKQREEVKGNRAGWVCKHLQTPPGGGDIRDSSPAVFRAKIRPADLLERARMWIGRSGYHFERFISMDLRAYMTQDETVNDVEYHARINRLRQAFALALSQARPLAAVDETMVNTVHGTPVSYRYSFSEVPFKDLMAANELKDVLKSTLNITEHTHEVFSRSLTDARKIRQIDVFGSYPNYSPIVFSSLLPPIADDWASRVDKQSAWRLRRSRPLSAFLPLSDDERKALVAGWIIGLATGRIYVHNQGQANAQAYIYDGHEWLEFPSPMLTSPAQMRHPVDWMPVVLESILLAYAQSHHKDNQGRPAQSLRPYWVLREIYDNSANGPTNDQGGIVHPAVSVMAEFLRNGVFPAKQNEVVGTDIEDRAALIIEALTKAGALADKFVPDNASGFPGAAMNQKEWVNPPTRKHAAQMPYYRDFASDVLEMVRRIRALLDQAKQLAAQPITAPSAHFGADQLAGGNLGASEFGEFGGLV